MAIGPVTARSSYQVVLGRNNQSIGEDSWVVKEPKNEDTLFILGNGHAPATDAPVIASNAITVKWSGDTRISGALTIDGGDPTYTSTFSPSTFKRNVLVEGVLRVRQHAGDIDMGPFKATP